MVGGMYGKRTEVVWVGGKGREREMMGDGRWDGEGGGGEGNSLLGLLGLFTRIVLEYARIC